LGEEPQASAITPLIVQATNDGRKARNIDIALFARTLDPTGEPARAFADLGWFAETEVILLDEKQQRGLSRSDPGHVLRRLTIGDAQSVAGLELELAVCELDRESPRDDVPDVPHAARFGVECVRQLDEADDAVPDGKPLDAPARRELIPLHRIEGEPENIDIGHSLSLYHTGQRDSGTLSA